MTRAATGLMLKQQKQDPKNRRSVVAVNSNAGSTPHAGMSVYSASEAAAAAFNRAAGLELAPHGTRCNVVVPGTTRTPMLDELESRDGGLDRLLGGDTAAFRTAIPPGRIADPEDVAEVSGILLTPQARQLTLPEVMADGGAAQR